jgi:hypothetical protein
VAFLEQFFASLGTLDEKKKKKNLSIMTVIRCSGAFTTTIFNLVICVVVNYRQIWQMQNCLKTVNTYTVWYFSREQQQWNVRKIYIYIYIFDMSTQGYGRGGIRSCDLRFIKRGSQPIELPLGDMLEKY